MLGRARMVTLTGAGGAGKSRLAVEVAGRLRSAFPGGVWLADLSSATEPSDVARMVTSALGVVDLSAVPATDKVASYLGTGRTLLVLDNCELIADACAALADQLLSHVPGLRILATSRRAIGACGEHIFQVSPLSAPAPGDPVDAAAAGRYDAVTLLVDRTTALRPGFAVTDENAAAIATICARLDGLPLGIEIAASRLRSLSAAQLAERLERRFSLLLGPDPAARPEPRTMWAILDWSYLACAAAERRLWQRLSVFADGFDLEAAESVCADDDLPEPDILETLDRLVARSIVVAETDGDLIRFRLLGMVRQYGRERLADVGQELEFALRHRDCYLALARRIAAACSGPGQTAGLARLRIEHGNLLAALETSMADPAGPRGALALVVALRQHWWAGGFLSEGRRWLDRALSLPGQERATEIGGRRVDALLVAAWTCLMQGDAETALARLEEADDLTVPGDHRVLGFARCLRGSAELFAGRLPRARRLLKRAREDLERVGDADGLLWTLLQLAAVLGHLGELEEAAATCEAALRLSEERGERLMRSHVLRVLGLLAWERGQADADAIEREALRLERGFDDPIGVALVIEALTSVAVSEGRAGQAARLLATGESVWALAGTTVAAFGPALEASREKCVARITGAVGEPALRTARRQYRYRDVASAIAAVLGDSTRPDPERSLNRLTPRERDVAELIAEGMSNRAIAGQLALSPRTVDGHVERILAKLGFSSRAQVAAWAATGRK